MFVGMFFFLAGVVLMHVSGPWFLLMAGPGAALMMRNIYIMDREHHKYD